MDFPSKNKDFFPKLKNPANSFVGEGQISVKKKPASEGDAGGDWIEGFGKNRERWHNCLYEEILQGDQKSCLGSE